MLLTLVFLNKIHLYSIKNTKIFVKKIEKYMSEFLKYILF